MRTVVDEFDIIARTSDSGALEEAWCEVPHTAKILGLSCRRDGGFKLVCQYTEEDSTPATLVKRALHLLLNGGTLPKGAKVEYVGTAPQVPGSFSSVHVFVEAPR